MKYEDFLKRPSNLVNAECMRRTECGNARDEVVQAADDLDAYIDDMPTSDPARAVMVSAAARLRAAELHFERSELWQGTLPKPEWVKPSA